MNKINVVADKITPRKIFYTCPFCFTSTSNHYTYDTNKTKGGKIIKNRLPTIHHHGNERQTIEGNWETERTSHCQFNRAHVYIKINEETKRECI